jgi:hypothetical protein
MIFASSPSHATVLLCITIANTLVVDPAPPVAAFLIRRPPLRSPGGAWTPSSSYRTIDTTATATMTTSLRLFGNIFGKDGADARNGQREGELARISIPAGSSSSPIDDVAFDSLSIMMREWSKLFVVNDLGEKKITGLTTPVEVVDLYSPGADDEEHGDVVKSSGVRLLFKKGKTGGRSAYRDKDDVARNNKDEVDGQKDNVDAVKEGGIEVRVEKMSSGELRVIASRCEIEEGTMTKEMSEEVIIDSLGKAVSAWRKERALLR